jgi:hypothetical protein
LILCLITEWKSDNIDFTYCTNTNYDYFGSLTDISSLSNPKDFEIFINDVTEGFSNLVEHMKLHTDEMSDDEIEELIKIQNELGNSQFISLENDIDKRKQNFAHRERVLSNRAKDAYLTLSREIINNKKKQKWLYLIISILIFYIAWNYYYMYTYSFCPVKDN